MNFSKDEYRLDFFVDEGFQRKKCEKCGKFFWSRDAQRKTCGDPPCDPYTFIGSPIFNEKYNMDEMREKYLTFFSDRGHPRIQRYPVAGPNGFWMMVDFVAAAAQNFGWTPEEIKRDFNVGT